MKPPSPKKIFQRNFICRSAEYNYVTLQCRLSDYDRRTTDASLKPVELVEAAGVDYFENLCLSSTWHWGTFYVHLNSPG